ncbi:MAG TPA: glycoside hydrolase family 36 protein [Cellulomonas sp.]
MTSLTWGSATLPLHLDLPDDGPVTVGLAPAVPAPAALGAAHRPRLAAVELLVLGEGRALTSVRTDRTAVGDRLRYVAHREEHTDGRHRLDVDQVDPVTGLEVGTTLLRHDDLPAYRATTTVRNGGDRPVTLQAVSSLALRGLTGFLGDPDRVQVWTARNEWCAESRWSAARLTGPAGLPDLDPAAHGQPGRGSHSRTGTSTWSSGEHVPVAALVSDDGPAVVWQIETGSPWRWELNSQYDPADLFSLVLLGPEDLHHAWTRTLAPGQVFSSVPVSIALGRAGLADAVGALTRHRRRSHLPATADAGRPLIFNDYMNALMGDPTTERLLPLIDAARSVGAQVFCIDAGWYDDGFDWWPSVGAWEPSTRRFGDLGLVGVLDRIRATGMRPGLWVEPEVIGVRSPRAADLPEEAFMHRAGVRIVEHDRYFLDLRSAAARDHLDRVFDRLVTEYGAGYFKWDYNVTPGAGPDSDASGPGDGLLEHARAHLRWFEALRGRHPEVVFEACSSGAQRMDASILDRYDLQSTSDQQDYRLYPTIAAAAPMAMAPEQAGNWAYPQPEMTDEQIAFTLVTGLSGRLYLSGHQDRLDERQRDLVRAATALYPEVIAHHAAAVPCWPLGLPEWEAPTVAVASVGEATGEAPGDTLLFVWHRAAPAEVVLPVPHLRGRDVQVDTLYPPALADWAPVWDAAAGLLRVRPGGEQARVLRLRIG